MEDSEIVELYWQRDEKAIDETAKKYEAYLLRIAANVLNDTEDSRECINDTYLAAWNSMPVHRPCRLSAYLGKIARQIAIDLFRKRNSKKRRASEYAVSLSELEDCVPGGASAEKDLDTRLLRDAINAFLRALPETSRALFIGRYFFFDSVKAAAAYCGISEAGAKTRLFRIRQDMKEYLIKEGFEP